MRKLNENLISDLKTGKIAIAKKSSDDIKDLREIIRRAFPDDMAVVFGTSSFYRATPNMKGWTGVDSNNLPTKLISDFFIEEEELIFNEELIEQLKLGKIAVAREKGKLDELRQIREHLFPGDGRYVSGSFKYYFISEGKWTHSDLAACVPDIVPLSKFFITKSQQKMNYIIKPEQAQEIITMACQDWKIKLANLWSFDIALRNDIQITPEFRSEMLKAATTKQYNILLQMMPDQAPWFPGTLYFVMSSTARVWELRYASEKRGEFYVNQHKTGPVMTKTEYVHAEGITLPE